MGILRNIREEKFAQFVAAGENPREAKLKAGWSSPNGYRKLLSRQDISVRIGEILEAAAGRAQFSREKLLQDLIDDRLLARKLGQASAALKATEMLGKELHRMFVDRREVGSPGDFDNKTEDELKEFIQGELRALGLSGFGEIPENAPTEGGPADQGVIEVDAKSVVPGTGSIN